MTNYQRITAKVFGETATATGVNPQIAQFGSALAGTYVGTTDVDTIQDLTAWSNGFIDCVTPSQQFPPLPEMTGFGKVLSYQQAYLCQKGMPEWDSGTTYYYGDLCKATNSDNKICIYKSKVDNNTNNAVTNTTYWLEIPIEDIQTVGNWCVTTPTTISTASLNKPAVVTENYLNGTDGYIKYSDGLIIQWGKTPAQSMYQTPIPVNLLTSYSSTNFVVTATIAHNAVTNGTFGVYAYPSAVNGIIILPDSSADTIMASINWMTIGY